MKGTAPSRRAINAGKEKAKKEEWQKEANARNKERATRREDGDEDVSDDEDDGPVDTNLMMKKMMASNAAIHEELKKFNKADGVKTRCDAARQLWELTQDPDDKAAYVALLRLAM